jgi:hypothetical protein
VKQYFTGNNCYKGIRGANKIPIPLKENVGKKGSPRATLKKAQCILWSGVLKATLNVQV